MDDVKSSPKSEGREVQLMVRGRGQLERAHRHGDGRFVEKKMRVIDPQLFLHK